MTPLRRRMIQDMQLHGLAVSTQRTYVEAVKNFAKHYNRSPEQLGEEDIRRFFRYLTDTRHLAKSTIRTYLFALKFLYQKTLRYDWPVLNLLRIPTHKKLPVVLSRQEVRSLLAHIRRPAARLSSLMMYSCGLRVSEAVHLRAQQIDSRRMVVCVRSGKGRKDRYVPLPRRTLELLRLYWREHRPGYWLFPSQDPSRPIHRGRVLKCIKAAVPHAGLAKNVSCHTLRHSYATHLLEQGVELRVIQGILGHRSPRTTVLYVHLTQSTMKVVHDSINDLVGDI